MSFNCQVYDSRNNKESLYLENYQIGKLKFIRQSFCKETVATNVEDECKNKLPICFEASCTNPRCQNICIVYSNKKTGSMSLFSSLCIYFSNTHSIFHFHNKNDLLVYNIETLTVSDLCYHLNHTGKNVVIIEVYRPILDLCISNFFFALEMYCRPIEENEILTHYVEYITKIFNDLFFYLYHECNKNKLFSDHGINMKDSKINSSIFASKRNNITYVLARLKDSEIWPELLKDYLPESNFQIHRENDTENKCQGEVYKLFKEKYKLPKNFFDMIQFNDQFINYYTEEERTEYLAGWQAKLDPYEYISLTREEAKTFLEKKQETNLEDTKAIRNKIANNNRSTEGNCICDDCVQEREAAIMFYSLMKSNVIHFNFDCELEEK